MTLQPITNEKTSKIISLQALRAIAFLGILTSHVKASDLGSWGVSIFIILSGFVMYLTYRERNLPDDMHGALSFSIMKLKKLYPLHVITMLLSLVLIILDQIGRFTIKFIVFHIGMVILNIFLLQDWVPSSYVYFSLNGVAWYLSFCLFMYFMFPFIMKGLRKIKSNKETIITIFSVYGIQVLAGYFSSFLSQSIWIFDGTSHWFTYVLPLFRLGDFVIGCCLCYLYLNRNHEHNIFKYEMFEVFTLISIIVADYIFKNKIGFLGSEWFKYSILYTLSASATVYLFAIKKGFLTNIATNKLLIYLGNISAHAFLIHTVIVKFYVVVLNKYFGIDLNVWNQAILVFLLTILGTKIYVAVENNIKKKTYKKA